MPVLASLCVTTLDGVRAAATCTIHCLHTQEILQCLEELRREGHRGCRCCERCTSYSNDSSLAESVHIRNVTVSFVVQDNRSLRNCVPAACCWLGRVLLMPFVNEYMLCRPLSGNVSTGKSRRDTHKYTFLVCPSDC